MKPRLVASLVAAAVLASPAAAQTLSRYAPADSLMTLELNDLAGATRTAASFGRQVAAMDLLGAAPNDPALGLLGSALDREVLMALNLDRAGNPHVLLAARIPAANQKEIQGLVAKNLNDSRQAGKRVLSYRAGGLPFYSATSRDGSTENWGYEGGLLYFSDGLDVLAGFLRRAAGKAGGGLGGTRAYADAMNLAGPGHLRAWVNVGATGRMFNDLLAKDLMAEVGVNFAPVGQMLASFGRVGMSVRVTAAGLETATVINPDAASDPAMARLLVTPRVPLRAASVLPATVTGLSTGGWDPRAALDYVPAFMARMGVSSPADLLARETGIDYRSDIVPWLGNEMATATLPGGILGETVYLLSVKDEAAAASGVAKVMGVLRDRLPGLLDQLESLGEGAGVAPIELRDSGLPTTTTTINGTAVTTYPFADTVAVHAAVRNGFLYLTGSDAAMRDLLADGPRLSESPRYRATMARVPAGATGHGFSDVGGTLKAISPIMSGLLGFVLSETDEIGSAEANRLAGQVGNFLDFAAARAGVQVTWTETTNFGLRAKSFLPVKWQ